MAREVYHSDGERYHEDYLKSQYNSASSEKDSAWIVGRMQELFETLPLESKHLVLARLGSLMPASRASRVESKQVINQKQFHALIFIAVYNRRFGCGPSLRQLGDELGYSSKTNVPALKVIKFLVEHGLVSREPGVSRSLESIYALEEISSVVRVKQRRLKKVSFQTMEDMVY